MENPKVTPKEYRDFLEGVKLKGIYLKDVNAKVDRDLIITERLPKVSIYDTASYKFNKEGFKVENKFTLTSKNKERKQVLKIECTFVLNFTSEKEINDDLFEVYQNVSLPFNTWPFVRELAFSISSRMNIPPLTLPLLKG